MGIINKGVIINLKAIIRNKILYLYILLIFFSTGNLKSQNPQWIIYQTGNSGLPSNHISDIVIDSNNVKWIGTDNGLVRFYNQQWTVYNTSNSGITYNKIYRLAVDKQNNIWIGTIGHGLIKFDGINWTKYDTINSLGIILSTVLGIQVDNINNLWISGYGLLKFSNNNWTLYNTTNSGLPDNMTTDVKIENNIKWIGTVWQGLVEYNDTNWVVYNTTNSGLPMNFVQSIFIDNLKNIWVGTYMGGAAKFNSQNNNWTLYNTVWPGFPGNDIRTIFIQSNEVKWFGIAGAGVVKYNDTNVVLYGYPLTYVDLVGKIISDKYNNIWMATDNQLAIYNPNGVIGIHQNISSIPNEIRLYQNYPNPFNPETKIRFNIPPFNPPLVKVGSGMVTLKIYDITGKEIQTLVNEQLQPGSYEVTFDGSDLPSGVYFYRLTTEGFSETKKMVIMK